MKNKWLLFTVIYLSALTVSLSQLKVVPVLGIVAKSMNISMTQVSWLMSVFTLAGIILAIPGAAILGKLGAKKLLLTLMATLFIGNIFGAFTNSYVFLLVSRGIEGISFSMIILVGIVLITEWFKDGNTGSAIGIYTTFPAFASVVAMNLSLPIVNSLGLKSIWLIVATLAVICFVLVTLVIKTPEPQAVETNTYIDVKKGTLVEAASNGRVWLLAICQLCVGFVLFTFITIYPQLFSEFYDLDTTTANLFAGLNGLFGIPFCILSGLIIDKVHNAPLITLIAFIGMAISCFITTMLGPSTYIMHTLLIALFCGLVIPSVLYIAPGVAKRSELMGYSVAFVNLLYYLGIFLGAPVVLGAIAKSGWQLGTNIISIVSTIGIIAIVLFMAANKKKGAF